MNYIPVLSSVLDDMKETAVCIMFFIELTYRIINTIYYKIY